MSHAKPTRSLSLPIPARKLQQASQLSTASLARPDLRRRVSPLKTNPPRHTLATGTPRKPASSLLKKTPSVQARNQQILQDDQNNPFMAPASKNPEVQIARKRSGTRAEEVDLVAEKLQVFKSKFKNFNIFLDGIDAQKHTKLIKGIKELGAVSFALLTRADH